MPSESGLVSTGENANREIEVFAQPDQHRGPRANDVGRPPRHDHVFDQEPGLDVLALAESVHVAGAQPEREGRVHHHPQHLFVDPDVRRRVDPHRVRGGEHAAVKQRRHQDQLEVDRGVRRACVSRLEREIVPAPGGADPQESATYSSWRGKIRRSKACTYLTPINASRKGKLARQPTYGEAKLLVTRK